MAIDRSEIQMERTNLVEEDQLWRFDPFILINFFLFFIGGIAVVILTILLGDLLRSMIRGPSSYAISENVGYLFLIVNFLLVVILASYVVRKRGKYKVSSLAGAISAIPFVVLLLFLFSPTAGP